MSRRNQFFKAGDKVRIISLKEINSKTMESKVISNLYFAGEVIDIDGDTGGYNIQAAFSTGFLAAENIVKSLK